MNAIALGPLLISLPRLYAIAGALLLLLASRFLLNLSAQQQSRWFSGLLMAWLVAARITHVALNLDSYSVDPLAALKVWQPGYHPLGGMLAGLAWTAWMLRDQIATMIKAMALLVGAVALWLLLVTLAPMSNDFAVQTLPPVTLEDIEGNDVYLPDLAEEGDLVIVNLWATWCPPCRREMPLLADADQSPGVNVVVANQGEDLLPVVRYLDDQALNFRYALRDPQQTLMATFEAPGLPTTVLFDSQGKVLDVHVGELTRAHLNSWLAN